jgi:hypothetical protein
MSEKKFRIQRDRDFKPHHILIGAAQIALESAEAKTPGWLYPHSKLEMQINLANARRPVSSIGEMLDLFYPKLKPDEKYCLYSDGFSGSTSLC